jgi:tetratricopeptide (TPR) repeat protein
MKRAVLGALILSVTLSAAGEAQRIKLAMPVKQLEAASVKDPNDVTARYNLALGYWSEKKYDQAEEQLKDALSVEPRFALAHLALAMLPFARRSDLWNENLEGRVPVEWRDRLIDADRHYRTAFMMNPLLDLRILGAVSPKKSVLWDVDPYLSALYNEWIRGFDDFQTGDYAGAYLRLERLARDLNAAGRQSRRDVPSDLLWYRGLAAAHLGKSAEAAADFAELLDRAARDEDPSRLTYLPVQANTYRATLAAVHRAAGRSDEAARLYREVLENDAGAYMAHIALADLHEANGDLNNALLQRQAAAAANPDDFSTEVEIGITLARLGRLPEAEQSLKRAAAAQPRSPRPWYVLGLIQQQSGRLDEARVSYEKFLETVPSRFENEIADAKRRMTQLGG